MPDTPDAPRPVSGPGESDAEEFMRWLAARGVRVVPPGAVVVDPDDAIPDAVVRAALVGLRDSANAMAEGAHAEAAWRSFARRVATVSESVLRTGYRGRTEAA